ncbi:alpha-ketoglutarate-dependent dioxygenase AlkB family protein [Gilvimarinus agarilyticus]|uniref:alpha-ketoglutarate-dependent dioxygenase AlkB family protein n=1 Tax=Gilvimarinus agarilyticus TaxID=679259 RepID=UPI00059FF71B|nr:alpha-ketoglutarate-dependent dioxygenase AlkB [Gilvimarinus agarilyticus]
MSQQPDLFASKEPQTLIDEDGTAVLYPQWLSVARRASLFADLQSSLKWEQTHLQMYGKRVPIPRLNAWYGDPSSRYSYSGAYFTPRPWTPALQGLRDDLSTVVGTAFNSVLANLYRTGRDSVAWHSDNEPELGPEPTIASLSLGADRVFVFRHIKSRRQVRMTLQDGDLLVMAGQLQRYWQHQLPKVAGLGEARINLTYRRVLA